MTAKDTASTSNPHLHHKTGISPHRAPGVFPGAAAGRTRLGTAGYPQRPPQPGRRAEAPLSAGRQVPALSAPAPAAPRCSASRASSQTRRALLPSVQVWLSARRTPSEPCFTYPRFMFSCVCNLCHYQHFFPKLCFSHFKHKPRALVCMQLKSGLASFLLLSLLSTLNFFFCLYVSFGAPYYTDNI